MNLCYLEIISSYTILSISAELMLFVDASIAF